MSSTMFCFQCEQTAQGKGCQGGCGVCGKSADVAKAQDALTGAAIGLARTGTCVAEDSFLLIRALFTTVTNVNFDAARVNALHAEIRARGGEPFDMTTLWTANEDVRSLKSLILFGIRGMAAYAYHARVLGYIDTTVDAFFVKALALIGDASATADTLLATVLETGTVNLACMKLLDQANTETYGTPEPTTVSLEVAPGPFIVVTGHDLHDLYALLQQTEPLGINVYTHGEMLPAHAYPKLKAFKTLRGHFGTAWQNQQKEFADLPAPILFTTNCIMPVRGSYADRVFTAGVVAYPDMPHVAADDFSAVIATAQRLGGYPAAMQGKGINGGTQVTTGFGHGAVMSVAGKVIDAVKAGKIKHIFLVGGCDGARPGRNYYTEFVKATPPDTLVLTLACGKFRFNDLDLGTIDGIPRLLDMGQCNDAYSAITVAVALAGAFKCGVNDLPLTLVLSWYEQKAVCILLTLLALGMNNMYLGPTLPAFLSPAVAKTIVERYKLHPTTTAQADLAAILGAKA